ncbi:MAG: hypothetical protein WB615_01095 [Candidatus Tumulicola sp.]
MTPELVAAAGRHYDEKDHEMIEYQLRASCMDEASSRWVAAGVALEREIVDCKQDDEMRSLNGRKRTKILPTDKNDETATDYAKSVDIQGFTTITRSEDAGQIGEPDFGAASRSDSFPPWLVTDYEINAWNADRARRFNKRVRGKSARTKPKADSGSARKASGFIGKTCSTCLRLVEDCQRVVPGGHSTVVRLVITDSTSFSPESRTEDEFRSRVTAML